MPERARRTCCGQESSPDTAQSRRSGGRRRGMVRWAVLVASAALCLAAVAVTLLGGGLILAHRLAWGAAICASGVAAGWVREAMTGGRPGWRLLLAAAALAAGLGWQPLVPAITAVAVLTWHGLRHRAAQPAPDGSTSPDGGVDLRQPATTAGLGSPTRG